MKNLSITLCMLTCFTTVAFAQLTPRSTTPSIGSGANNPTQTSATPAAINTRTVNGITLQLKKVKGNSADQTVTLEFVISNPKGNAQVMIRNAYSVDFEGDNYSGVDYLFRFFDEMLYTDVPRKAFVSVNKVPSKIKALALFKFSVYNSLVNQDVDAEYRNLTIEW